MIDVPPGGCLAFDFLLRHSTPNGLEYKILTSVAAVKRDVYHSLNWVYLISIQRILHHMVICKTFNIVKAGA